MPPYFFLKRETCFFFLQDSNSWVYLIIANAVPAASLIRQSLQLLDPELQGDTRCIRQVQAYSRSGETEQTGRARGAPYLDVDAVLEAALWLRLHQPVAAPRAG